MFQKTHTHSYKQKAKETKEEKTDRAVRLRAHVMRLKKGLPQLTSSKAVFRTFLATLKQSQSSCITDCQHDFEKGKHLENTFK